MFVFVCACMCVSVSVCACVRVLVCAHCCIYVCARVHVCVHGHCGYEHIWKNKHTLATRTNSNLHTIYRIITNEFEEKSNRDNVK